MTSALVTSSLVITGAASVLALVTAIFIVYDINSFYHEALGDLQEFKVDFFVILGNVSIISLNIKFD